METNTIPGQGDWVVKVRYRNIVLYHNYKPYVKGVEQVDHRKRGRHEKKEMCRSPFPFDRYCIRQNRTLRTFTTAFTTFDLKFSTICFQVPI